MVDTQSMNCKTLLNTLLSAMLAWCCCGISLAIPSDFLILTREPALMAALDCLATVGDRDILNAAQKRGTRLLFRNMAELGPQYARHDALTVISRSGQQVIYVNQLHQQAPPQAIAALVRHELMHDDTENSLAEEEAAWRQEAKTWWAMLKAYPDVRDVPTGRFALVDRENAILLLDKQQRLTQTVRQNVAYEDLPAHSSGY